MGLSTALCSDQDVSPTQAWNYIRGRPLFGGLEAQHLGKLAVALRDTVKCHGYVCSPSPTWSHTGRRAASIGNNFGAVVDRTLFDPLISQLPFKGQPYGSRYHIPISLPPRCPGNLILLSTCTLHQPGTFQYGDMQAQASQRRRNQPFMGPSGAHTRHDDSLCAIRPSYCASSHTTFSLNFPTM